MCMSCRHYDRQSEDLACGAYPGGIPSGILSSEVDHRQRYSGDHGVRFEPDPRYPLPDGYLEMLFPHARA